MDAYIGMVLLTGFNFAPLDWLPCDGRLLEISQYDALFSLIGTTYGGDGMTTFALPDLRGRVPVGVGPLLNGQFYSIGQAGGTEQVGIGMSQYPTHTHALMASSSSGTTGVPSNAMLASGQSIYASSNATLPLNNASLTASGGGSQMHPNLQPYVTLNWVICANGIYPPRS